MKVVASVYTFELVFEDDERNPLQVDLCTFIEFLEGVCLWRKLLVVGLEWLLGDLVDG